jgi:Protein of unknown function (DUF4232)
MVVGVVAAACSSSPGTSTSSGTAAAHRGTTTTSTAPTPTSAPASTSTSSTAVAACSSVTATAGATQGAAGTITGTITLTAAGTTPCTIFGYPSLARYAAGGASVPVTVVNGLTVDVPGAATTSSTVTLTSSQGAAFTYQFSDVPTGTETQCATSASLTVTTPGAASASPQFPLTMAPCDNGTVRVSPVYAASAAG